MYDTIRNFAGTQKNAKVNILLIEDEIDLLESIREYLESESFLVTSATSFSKAAEKIALYKYDCIVVDINLPDGSGLNIIRELKLQNNCSGIIIISAKNSLDDKLTGLDIGADDYLTKPFHLSELNSRIKSIIRRRQLNGHNQKIFNEIKIDFTNRIVEVNNQAITLTRKEYDLLLYFMMNMEKVLSKEDIAEHLWGDDMSTTVDSFDFLYNHIKNLRRKMIDKGCKDYIKTIYGIGYKFSA